MIHDRLEFKNLLAAEDLGKLKGALGLQAGTNWAQIIPEAIRQGFDGIRLGKGAFGTEYVALPGHKSTPLDQSSSGDLRERIDRVAAGVGKFGQDIRDSMAIAAGSSETIKNNLLGAAKTSPSGSPAPPYRSAAREYDVKPATGGRGNSGGPTPTPEPSKPDIYGFMGAKDRVEAGPIYGVKAPEEKPPRPPRAELAGPRPVAQPGYDPEKKGTTSGRRSRK